MAETSMREGVREVTDQMRPSEINPKLEEAVQNQPLLPHLLSFRVVGIALAAGLVVALLLFLLLSPMLAGVALILVFFGTWFGMAARDYGKADAERQRRQDEKAAAEDDEG